MYLLVVAAGLAGWHLGSVCLSVWCPPECLFEVKTIDRYQVGDALDCMRSSVPLRADGREAGHDLIITEVVALFTVAGTTRHRRMPCECERGTYDCMRQRCAD
mmetsp:Transcript_27246/g.67971  ORF Transcript_27246/g.67971 Transcript_27246/m.67971 type:complete len:103 (+) Transcript_27246:908-1216(+)